MLGLQLDVAWTNYYDYFPVVDFKVLADHTSAAIKALTSMLGFECSLGKEFPLRRQQKRLESCSTCSMPVLVRSRLQTSRTEWTGLSPPCNISFLPAGLSPKTCHHFLEEHRLWKVNLWEEKDGWPCLS